MQKRLTHHSASCSAGGRRKPLAVGLEQLFTIRKILFSSQRAMTGPWRAIEGEFAQDYGAPDRYRIASRRRVGVGAEIRAMRTVSEGIR